MSGNTDMSFWEHLEALRGVLFRAVALLAVLAVASFCVMPYVFDHVILAPCRPDFPFYRLTDSLAAMCDIPGIDPGEPFSISPVSLELTSQFFIHMSASCWMAVVLGFPALIYILWGFVSPALYDHERRGIRRAFLAGNLMFYAGMSLGYLVVFPLALRFLASYSLSPTIATVISLDSYMDNFFTLILVMGAVFELPLLCWLLGKMGLLTRGFFRKYRRHAIVALLICAGLITPTGDPFTLFAVFLPIYALWEASGRLVPRAGDPKQASVPVPEN